MPASFVADASLMGAAFFQEAATPAARRFLERGLLLIAPDLLWTEMASLAAKKVWRGEARPEVGRRAVEAISDFVGEVESIRPLARRAFELAAAHKMSAYDATYLALAEARNIPIATLDIKFAAKIEAADLGRLVFTPA